MKAYRSTLVLLLLAALVGGAGAYATFVQQPAELEKIEDQRQLARLQHAEVQDLLAEQSISQEAADQAVAKWNARYKYIPREMNTPDIVQYLESLTRRGFDSFNIRIDGRHNSADVNRYTFNVQGTAFYSSLYDFVWHIENNRDLYRIRDLSLSHTTTFDTNPQTEEQRRHDMVQFSLKLDAYYGGRDGLSLERHQLIPISRDLLPSHNPFHNSFYPIVRDDLPPNDENLLEIENARLISISGGRATLQDGSGTHVVREGDRIYLGRITRVDAANTVVEARLNKGGITSDVEVKMEIDDESYRESTRGRRLVPVYN